MFHNRLTKIIFPVIVSLCITSCSSSSLPKGSSEFPDESHSDTLPTNATEISEQMFSERLESGKLILASFQTLKDQTAQQADDEARDDETIAVFKAGNPDRPLPFLNDPAENDPTVTPLANGNYSHTIRLNNGTTDKVITMSQQFIKHQFAEAVRTFPTRKNQFTMYRGFYEQLPEDWRRELELVNPETIENNPDTYPVSSIESLNNRISINAMSIIGSITETTIPEGYVSDPTLERGYFDGSDSSGSNPTSPDCGFQATGIRNAYDWPMKYYVTSTKDQRKRGTCVSFANTAAIETHVAKKYGIWTNLSEQAHYNRMKLTWERNDFGDSFLSETGFTKMAEENWLLPFEDQWPYNPSISRTTGIAWCTTTECEEGSSEFQTCATNCAASFAVNSQAYDDCVQTDCRDNSTTFQECQKECTGLDDDGKVVDPTNRQYYFSCNNYTDTCSDSTHQSELVCQASGSGGDVYYTCGYTVPEKNPDNYGYRITTSAQIWDNTSPQTIEFSFAKLLVALTIGNPVVIGHPVTTAFDDASDDGFMTYTANDTNRGGHGMLAVGFIDNEQLAEILPTAPPGTGGGYIIVKNSWSNCWGDGGYIYIPYQSIKDYTPDATILHGVQ